MVRGLKIVSLLLLGLYISSCQSNGDTSSSLLPDSSGKYGEVLVVVDSSLENGTVGSKLEEIFYKAMDGMPQREALFRMSTVDPSGFRSILKRSRNLLKISYEKDNSNKVKVDRDVWAKDQLLINIYCNSEESAVRILEKNTQTIRDYFNEEELKRLKKQYSKKPNEDLIKKVKESYNINLLIPPGYVLMENDENSFWIKKEKQFGQYVVIQGLMVYKQAYTSDSTFTTTFMADNRDKISSKLVQGFRDSSYMQVFREYEAVTAELSLADQYSKEYRGLWNMKNDFMGGPFLHYTLVDQKNKEVIDLDAFVYAPNFNKREYLRELEAIIKTIKLN